MAQAGSARALVLTVGVGLAIAAKCYDLRAGDAGSGKLATEAQTRESMERIRQRVIDVHTLITHRRMPVASSRKFAKDVADDVERIAHARIDIARDGDPIASILRQISRGAATVADPNPERGQIEGLVDVVAGLEAYAAAFNHPGWRPLQDQ